MTATAPPGYRRRAVARPSDRLPREGDGRGLASRAARWFSATAIMHAQSYADDGMVKVTDLATRTAVARVQGSLWRPYTVDVAAPVTAPGTLRCGCSCAVGERGETCKHMYAVLLMLDRNRVDLAFDAQRARVEVAPLWVAMPDRPIDAWDAIVDVLASPAEPEPVRAVRRVAPKPAPPVPVAPPVAPPPTLRPRPWTERMRWLAAPTEAVPAPALGYTLEYHLAAVRPVDAHGRPADLPGRIAVAAHQRTLRRDGAPGRRELRRLALDGSDPAPEPADRPALDALRLATPIVDDGTWYQADSLGGAGRAPTYLGVHVAAGLVDRLLPPIAATGRLGWLDVDDPGQAGPLRPLRWDGDAPFRLIATLALGDDGLAVTASVVRGDERIALSALSAFFGAGCAAVGERLIRVEHGEDLARWWASAGWAPMRIPAGQVGKFVEQLAGLARLPALEVDPATGWRLDAGPPTPQLLLEPWSAGGHTGLIAFGYGPARRDPRAAGALVLDPLGRVLHVVDHAAEARLREALYERLPSSPPPAADVIVPAGGLGALVPALEALGWQVWLRSRRVRAGGRLKATVASGIDWFDVSLTAAIGDVPVDALALLDALRTGRDPVRLHDGTEGVLPAGWLEQHRALVDQGEIVDGQLRVPRNRALVLDLLLEALPDVELDASFRRLRDRLVDFAGVAARTEPTGFAGELRPYQREGLGWLAFLRELGFGGCLADDMGLGKTVQVLAAIVELQRGRGPRRPTLVVAPKSVVWNWLDEAARFAPGLRVVDYSGPDRRARLGELDRAALVVTSYATMRLDIAELSTRTFAYLVLDEAQAIKNPDAQVARAARALRGEHRLALTGTPVENHLGDLASIFEFLNPGMLDGVAALRALASRPPTEAGELAPLARALRPFLLRRTKTQVLPDLPARSEQVLMVRLEGAQRRFYDQLREGYRASLLGRVERDGMAGSTMHVLEALLRLRQAACAPELVAAERAPDGSAKLDLLLEQLAEVCAEGHKVLVFSQFTSFLALVRGRLEDAGIGHEYLDGQTRDRKARVARFQGDPTCQVFVISLKAGGTGLNLTAASYVYLLDPWWNPAVEAQAIDRSHRLGQTRAVTAYRLIAEDTVEDKILALQRHKQTLLEGLFAEDAGRMASLTAADLALLLAP